MKTLFLVRHAKSSWECEDLEDYFRPLKPSGVIDALKVSSFLKREQIFSPEIIVTSPAIRAFSTALIFSKELEVPETSMILKNGIYESSKEELFSVVQAFDDSFDKVMMFGHDCSLTDFINCLATDNLDKTPTSAVVGIQLNISSWKDLKENTGRVMCFISPKQI